MAGKAKDKPWYWAVLVLLAGLGLYILFIGDGYLRRLVEVERGYNEAFYTAPIARKAAQRGSDWFESAFVDTQVMAHTFEPFVPTEAEMARAGEVGQLGRPLFDWFEGRMRAWWTLLWAAFTRLSTVLLWLPYAPVLILPWMVDGYAQREIRKFGFHYASPLLQSLALRALILCPTIFLLVLIAPLPLHPLGVPLSLVLIGAVLQQIITHLMKRL